MESILAKALEYTLKYWLKSFTRDQFKLQGRTAQLSNLDIDGDALHSSLGLPPAIHVTTAKVGKLEIVLPSVSNVQVEPIVVQIDRLDLVLEENADADTSSAQSTSSSGRGSGYGFADKIADGMTIEVQTVNLLLETRGAGCRQGGATWTPPMASITMRNLLLYTTNENWEVVNLKEARDFSSNKDFIYVFKKLEWGSLSIDLLPHPDMFMDGRVQEGANKRDDDGAKRVFFGGERFLEGISGQAYITVQRTQLNDPLGLEARLHIIEAVCPALSEPGLRAFLRFLTGLYVCLNRGDVDPKAQRSTEAAGRSLVSIIVDHVFLCIRDTDFRLELLMQSLCFTRTSISDRESSKNLTQVIIGGLFLRDTFSRPPCTLIQPSMQALRKDLQKIPDFAKDFSPPIYPLGDKHWQVNEGASFINIHSLQVTPSPAPPLFASQTVIACMPLMIHLQEESCLRICSFLADGVVVNSGSVLPDYSINSMMFTLNELDLTVPLDFAKAANCAFSSETGFQNSVSEAKLHIKNLFLSESPVLQMLVLDLEKDPACFCLWDNQPIDASQKKWSAGASYINLSLETSDILGGQKNSSSCSMRSWRCVEVKEACVEVAMATLDGSLLVHVPPPGGIARIGIACKQYCSNTSVEQLFFVLDLYSYFGEVSEKIALVGKNDKSTIRRTESWNGELISKAPSDTAVSFTIKDIQLKFVEDSNNTTPGKPLVQFIGENLFIKVGHRTLGGAIAISSTVRWETVEVDCVDVEDNSLTDNDTISIACTNGSPLSENGHPQLRPVLWIEHKDESRSSGKAMHSAFLDVNIVHVIPSQAQDAGCHSLNVSACIDGVRLGGGMNYAEALLHRFGILGPGGGPSEGLLKGLENLSASPLSKVFKAPPHSVDYVKENGTCESSHETILSHLGRPDDVDVSVELRNWLFALEGAQETVESSWSDNRVNANREERCWHSCFKSLKIKGKNDLKDSLDCIVKSKVHKYPVELITIGVEGLQTLKPQVQTASSTVPSPARSSGLADMKKAGGVNVEVRMVVSEDDFGDITGDWTIENLKFSVDNPIEAVVTKDELQHLTFLCKSEVDSFGRVAAGVLRLLKLEGSIGQGAINQLSNLGNEGLDKIFSPRQLTWGENAVYERSFSSSGLGNSTRNSPHTSMKTIISSLEKEVEDMESKYSALIADISGSETSSQHLDRAKEIGQHIESLQRLLKQLKTQG
ncbi:uncharacterized protein LOC130807247 [Amaranthus tricolor]|uniref:uncharacterized protein LOC130807247 n=1 Tax=Amaranthus tricolor TaxID=29722 RepID=UPI0025893F03|nr:uncharacterized protein LOC130807247 [Amaranthus tricolor]